MLGTPERRSDDSSMTPPSSSLLARFQSTQQSLDMLEDIVVYTMALRVGQGAIKGSGYITAGVNCAIDSRAGLCCYNVSTDTDEYVATVVGEGNTGARLEGTDWDITLRYAVSCPGWVYLFECNMGG